MSLIALGCHHKTSSLTTLEQLAVSSDELPKILVQLTRSDNLSEAVVLSTCHRVEVYAYAEKFHGGCTDICETLAAHSGLPYENVYDEFYVLHDDQAVHHLFKVASGLESVVIGEHEILGQIRNAWHTACEQNTVGITLNPLFRWALAVGKKVRSCTAIGRGVTSVSQAAVALAQEYLGQLAGRDILVLGAGEAGAGTLKSFASAGVAELVVANRTWERAAATAKACGGKAVPSTDLIPAMVAVDLMVTTTGANKIILEHCDIESVMKKRNGRPLLIIDLAVPRDVHPSANHLPGVTLLNMDDLSAFTKRGINARDLEVDKVHAIIDNELHKYHSQVSAREVAPVIAALRGQIERICTSELARYKNRLDKLDEPQKAAVESLLRSVTRKFLHKPTVRLKESTGQAQGSRLAEAVVDLFALPEFTLPEISGNAANTSAATNTAAADSATADSSATNTSAATNTAAADSE